jgi:DmsE family decaheme c-type cytochrome
MRLKIKLAALALSAGVLLGHAVPAAAAVVAAARADPAVCIECHDDEDLPDMSRSAHAPLKKKAVQGAAPGAAIPDCISCHGASPTHVKKPEGVKDRPAPDVVFSKKTRADADARSDICMSCHQKDSKRHLWAGSAHQRADLACSSCHKVHTNRDKVMAKLTQADTCYACHKEQRTQLAKLSHHPVPEGAMTCSDCHNAHGSAGPKLARRDSTNATCTSCHAEKRGPFVHAHEPVADDCTSCHNAHGSNIAAMLKARPPMLCQQCHTPHVAGGVGAVGGQRGVFTPAIPGRTEPLITSNVSGKNVVNLWQGRSCMNCHTQVHGSNNPSTVNATPQLLQR